MHYYQFNIADYRKDTAHLSPMEHYIYRTLMDWYYLDEEEIPQKTQWVLRRLQLGNEHQELLQNVLEDFFLETETGWSHKRIEDEIADYQGRAAANRENGKKGGRPKKQQLGEDENPQKTQPVSGRNPMESGKNPNQEPLTKNQVGSGRTEYQQIADLYNEILGEHLSKVRSVSPDRHKHLKARITEDPKRQDVDWWRRYFTLVLETPGGFLLGQGPPKPDTGKPWRADFDWLINANNLTKVIEGKYEQ